MSHSNMGGDWYFQDGTMTIYTLHILKDLSEAEKMIAQYKKEALPSYLQQSLEIISNVESIDEKDAKKYINGTLPFSIKYPGDRKSTRFAELTSKQNLTTIIRLLGGDYFYITKDERHTNFDKKYKSDIYVNPILKNYYFNAKKENYVC
jgi:hypothetical protein